MYIWRSALDHLIVFEEISFISDRRELQRRAQKSQAQFNALMQQKAIPCRLTTTYEY